MHCDVNISSDLWIMAALITTVSSFTSQYFEINQVRVKLPQLYTSEERQHSLKRNLNL